MEYVCFPGHTPHCTLTRPGDPLQGRPWPPRAPVSAGCRRTFSPSIPQPAAVSEQRRARAPEQRRPGMLS